MLNLGIPGRGLADPNLKAARAKEHLDCLKAELLAFYESEPCRLVPEDDIENQRYCIHLHLAEPPACLWLITGDLFYCLRAALDQLVWRLAKLSLPYPEGTQFPIFDVCNAKTRRRFADFTRGVPATAVDIIESLQPYHGPDANAIHAHLLWKLNTMCNIDKHRHMPVSGSITQLNLRPIPGATPLPKGTPIHGHLDNRGIVSFPLSLKEYLTLDPNVGFKVTFGDSTSRVECDIEGIERIYDFVANDVIPRFACFFQ